MKKRNNDGPTGLIWAGVGILLVVIAAVVVISLTRRARTAVNDVAGEAFEMLGEASNMIKNTYDGNTITGSEVIDAINKYASAGITVNVKTKAAAAAKAYNAAYTDPGAAAADHINESAMFTSTVGTNTNGEVDSISFVQK